MTTFKKTNTSDLNPRRTLRLVNSVLWLVIIVPTLAIGGEYWLTLLAFEMVGWFYLDRSFKKQPSSKGSQKSLDELLDEVPEVPEEEDV